MSELYRPTRLRVALAEDEPLMRMYLQETLSILGHEVVVMAADGQELVEQCRRLRPDLVLTDINMPVLDGLEAARLVCRELCTPVVVITGYDFIEETSCASGECPILLYLVKPVTDTDLNAAIRVAMLRYHQLRECFEDEADIRAAFADWSHIEAAKARLMARSGADERQAFDHLMRRAKEEGRSLLDAADAVLKDLPKA